MTHTQAVEPLAFPSDAELLVPGSKSEANRLLVAAALSGSSVTITGASASDDVRHLVAGLATLGFDACFVDEQQGIVRVGPRRAGAPTSGELFCGNAGTALRFLLSVAAITEGQWTLTGDEHMQTRPIEPLVDAWRQLGVDIESSGGCPPVRVRGGTATGGHVTIDPSVSSQFVSSLLLVGAQLRDGLDITFSGILASRSYAELTCSLLARVGVRTTLDSTSAHVTTERSPAPAQLAVGGDWSAMGTWTCLNHLDGSRIRASNLVTDSGQADEGLAAALRTLEGDGERTVDVETMPDQFLNLAIVSAFRNGTTTLTGAANVRVKECDRIAVMARELQKLGVAVTENHDGLSIRGGNKLRGGVVDPENDHRVAMAFAMAALRSPGIRIAEPQCVHKSYPTFWGDLERVRARHRTVAIIGMRASGKSSFGNRLAACTGSDFVDTDQVFIKRHGAINSFVETNGWQAFRAEEERIVAASLRTGSIVATGGGAIESEATRKRLQDDTFALYLATTPDVLRQRLGSSKRPSLTGASIIDELNEVFARREPFYVALANRTIDANLPFDDQLRIITRPATQR